MLYALLERPEKKSRCIWETKKPIMMCKNRSKRRQVKTFLSKLKIDKDRVSVVISTNKSKTKIRTTSPLQKEFSKKKKREKKRNSRKMKNLFTTSISLLLLLVPTITFINGQSCTDPLPMPTNSETGTNTY